MPSVVAQHLNETIKCTLRPSRLGGVGVFAIRDIKEGELLSEYHYDTLNMKKSFIKMTRKQFEEVIPEVQSVILDRIFFNKDQEYLFFLSPNQDQYLQTFMNHSLKNNSDGQYAKRFICKGEEITLNYREMFPEGEELDELTLKHMPFIWK